MWKRNEGEYEVRWEKPISIDGAEGLEFVWGAVRDNRWDTAPSLNAIYYSEQHELDIRLSTYFNLGYMEISQAPGFADIISSKFSIFEHMVHSVHLVP